MAKRKEDLPLNTESYRSGMAQLSGIFRAIGTQEEIAKTGTSSVYGGALADFESLSGKKPEERTPEENQRFVSTRALLNNSFGGEMGMFSTFSVWVNARPLRKGNTSAINSEPIPQK